MNENEKQKEYEKIKIVCFGGGGIKGISLGGLNYVLHKHGVLKNVKVFAGVSIGAILALLNVCGYTPIEIIKLCVNEDINQFVGDVRISNLLEEKYLSSGVKIKEYLGKLLNTKGFSKEITARELYDKTGFILVTFSFFVKFEELLNKVIYNTR